MVRGQVIKSFELLHPSRARKCAYVQKIFKKVVMGIGERMLRYRKAAGLTHKHLAESRRWLRR
jgi:hypothetical protein